MSARRKNRLDTIRVRKHKWVRIPKSKGTCVCPKCGILKQARKTMFWRTYFFKIVGNHEIKYGIKTPRCNAILENSI